MDILNDSIGTLSSTTELLEKEYANIAKYATIKVRQLIGFNDQVAEKGPAIPLTISRVDRLNFETDEVAVKFIEDVFKLVNIKQYEMFKQLSRHRRINALTSIINNGFIFYLPEESLILNVNTITSISKLCDLIGIQETEAIETARTNFSFRTAITSISENK